MTALLAQGPGFPEGDTEHGLVLTACLTPQGQVDTVAYEADPLPWIAKRFWPDREPWTGELIRVDETGWALRPVSGEDEPLWDLEARIFRPGDYITLRRPDGEELIFRIVNVEAG